MRSAITFAVSVAAVVSAQSDLPIPTDLTPAGISSAIVSASSQIAQLPSGQQSTLLSLLSSYVRVFLFLSRARQALHTLEIVLHSVPRFTHLRSMG